MEIQKFEHLKNEKSFLHEITFFIVFEGLSFGRKQKFGKIERIQALRHIQAFSGIFSTLCNPRLFTTLPYFETWHI